MTIFLGIIVIILLFFGTGCLAVGLRIAFGYQWDENMGGWYKPSEYQLEGQRRRREENRKFCEMISKPRDAFDYIDEDDANVE